MTDPAAMPPAPPKAEGPGLFEDLIEIFATPAKVFARRARTGSAGAFFVVAIACAAVLYSGKSVMEPIMDAQMAKGIAAAQKANPSLTTEQLQSGIAMQKKFAPVIVILSVPIIILFLGLIIWIVGKTMGAAVTFASSVMIASFAYVPRIVGGVIVDIQGLLMSDTSTLTNPSQIGFSPARFLDPNTANAGMLGLLMRFDLMTIWVTVLIGVGFAAAGKLPRGKAAAAATIIWVLGSLFPIWGALRGS